MGHDDSDQGEEKSLAERYLELSDDGVGATAADIATKFADLPALGSAARLSELFASNFENTLSAADVDHLSALQRYEPLEIEVDTSPAETAANTERIAEILHQQHANMAALRSLTAESLALSEEQREASKDTERFSRRMTWVSVSIAGASLAVAVATIVATLAP